MSDPKRTPFYNQHVEAGGKMIDFFGWELPVQYDGIVAEHLRTRNAVSLFDVSHMGEFSIQGEKAVENLQHILSNDVVKLKIGQAQYNFLLNEEGCFIDDLIAYKMAEDCYMLCVNASNTKKDFTWIESQLIQPVDFKDISGETAQIALQGPKAVQVMNQLVDTDLSKIRYYHFEQIERKGVTITLAKMGYTGSPGFEIFCPWERGEEIWSKLIQAGEEVGIAPAGLGARDTLRLEAGFPLYGNDLDEQTDPLQAQLERFVAFDKGDFIGKQALVEKKKSPLEKTFVRFILEEKGVPRAEYPILDLQNQAIIGEVTSGNHSPLLGKGIGMGYVKKQMLTNPNKIGIKIRSKVVPAALVEGSFLPGKA